MTETLLAVDANNLLIRAVRAMDHVDLAANGVNTGPLTVFVNMLSRYVREVEPDFLVLCWDGGRSSYRLSVWSEYKIKRTGHDDEVDQHFVMAKEFLSLCAIHHVRIDGVEADDLVASYCRDFNGRSVILSGDKDFLQLLGDDTVQIRPTGGDELWTQERVLEKLGCTPENLPYVKALAGDSSDGIPGVPRIGSKTACKLLALHDWDIERLLNSTHRLLEGQREVVLRNLKLVDLRSPLPGLVAVVAPPRFEPTDLSGIFLPELLRFLSRYHLTTIKERLVAGALWKGEHGQVQRLHL